MAKRGAIFDLDRTLVRVNTAALFMRWRFREGQANHVEMARAFWWLFQYTLGVVDVEAIARRAALGMRGVEEAAFERDLRAWVDAEVKQHIMEGARHEVQRMREKGYLASILTSSTPYSAIPIAEAVGIEHVLASRLEVIDGRFTGDYLKPLCYGHGKVAAAEIWARAHDVDLAESAFYTDSVSDLPMLERVGEPVAVNPDPRLRWIAWRRGWQTEHW